MAEAPFNALPTDSDSAASVAFKILIHPASVVFDTTTTATLSWIAERGAVDEAQLHILRACREHLLRAEIARS